MERLTKKDTAGTPFIPYGVLKNKGMQYIAKKLAEYEDAEEQCIEENQCGLRELLLKWKEFFDDIAELYDYRKAEEQGVLLRLPCKVGDTVYIIQSNGQIKANEADMMFLGVMLDEYGKEWFTTKEEAESALAEKGGA